MFQACHGNNFNLGNLPSDVIRKIVGMLPIETVDEFRMISPKWNTFVPPLLSDKKCLPSIDRFTWTLGHRSDYVKLRTKIRNRDYFGVGWWGRDIGYGNSDDEIVDFQQDFITELETDVIRLRNCLNKIFSRCSQIGRFELSESLCEQFQFFKRTLNDVTVNELSVSELTRFDSTIAEILSGFIRTHSVQNLYLSINDSAIWNSIKQDMSTFLLTAIHSVEIYIKFNQNERKQFEFWAFVEIWQSRIRELIENSNFTERHVFEGPGVRVHLSLKMAKRGKKSE